MDDISLKESFENARRILAGHFPADEALSLAHAVYGGLLGYTPVDIVLRKDTIISGLTRRRIQEVVDRLLNDEPLQYILGRTRFCGSELIVTPDVLIPRPETEELVDIIVKKYAERPDLRVLDLCTGSGCIAVALARGLKFPVIRGIDISEKAVGVARKNARLLKVKVDFDVADVMSLVPPANPEYDIIVSNPPYVLDSEASAMERNVLDYEPHIALFVPDDDPLKFYRAIGRYAVAALEPGGELYLEINPVERDPLCRMLESFGFVDVQSMADMTGRQRFVVAKTPSDD